MRGSARFGPSTAVYKPVQQARFKGLALLRAFQILGQVLDAGLWGTLNQGEEPAS